MGAHERARSPRHRRHSQSTRSVIPCGHANDLVQDPGRSRRTSGPRERANAGLPGPCFSAKHWRRNSTRSRTTRPPASSNEAPISAGRARAASATLHPIPATSTASEHEPDHRRYGTLGGRSRPARSPSSLSEDPRELPHHDPGFRFHRLSEKPAVRCSRDHAAAMIERRERSRTQKL